MIPVQADRVVRSSGVLNSGTFGISQSNQVHILTILRDTLYTNKKRAVLREYGANGWDAQREIGKGDVPLKIALPTELEASLTIRDFGPGLSEADVYEVYTQYGASTKRNSNISVGMLGIGSKSAFAYNDSFTITSFNGGLKKVYHAVLDETNIGVVMKMLEEVLGKYLMAFLDWEGSPITLEEDTYYNTAEYLSSEEPPVLVLLEPDATEEPALPGKSQIQRFYEWILVNSEGAETGVEIKVPVNPEDTVGFQQESQWLFRYFRPMPDINIPLTAPKATWEAKNGFIRRAGESRYEDEWVAVMGCIPYRLNFGNLVAELQGEGLSEVISTLRGGLYFNIGEISVSANREEVEYKQSTKDAIVARLRGVLEEVSSEIDAILENPDLSNWEKRVKLYEFNQRTGIPLTDKYKDWRVYGGSIALYDENAAVRDSKGDALRAESGKAVTGARHFELKYRVSSYSEKRWSFEEGARVHTSTGTRLIFRDTSRSFRGYDLASSDHFVVPRATSTNAEALAELQELIVAAKLEGIPLLKMSQMPYGVKADSRIGNQKHSEKCFRLTATEAHGRAGYSENWEIVNRTPDPDDVFVIINRFEPTGYPDFWVDIPNDRSMMKNLFDLDLPEIYGIKTTMKAPVVAEDVEGTPLKQWRKETCAEQVKLRPDLQKAMEAYAWLDLPVGTHNWHVNASDLQARAYFEGKFGADHLLTKIFTERVEAAKIVREFERTGRGKKEAVKHLLRYIRFNEAANSAIDEVWKRYPLLRPANYGNQLGIGILLVKDAGDGWLDYINLVDSRK